ncbi:MAG: F0F1 ATP synthase subunit delta [Bacteroidales bacterium]|jgi:F-type H+-transporting ATPase subunit delta|nr:F0F1 ATP synthase subunit delta [Bacteroidales bacterium]
MDNGKISVRYARALLHFAVEQGCEQEVYNGLTRLVHNYMLAISQFNEVLSDPIVTKADKVKLLEMAVGEPLHDCLKQFITFVSEQHREDKMPVIAMKFMEMYRMKHNILSTNVTTATELPEATYDKIKAFIKQTFNAEAEIDVKIDPSLIGGFILDIEHTRMDASVAGQLNALKNKLKQ